MSSKPTLRDIAEATGVSTASVSMILNGKSLERFSSQRVASVLAEAESYTVMYRRMIERRSYCSRTGDMQSESFAFRPIKKTSGINCVYVADMHGDYEETENVASYFGDDLDLFIVNGDFGESDTLDDLVKLGLFAHAVRARPVGDVVVYAHGKRVWLLKHHAYLPPQFADVD